MGRKSAAELECRIQVLCLGHEASDVSAALCSVLGQVIAVHAASPEQAQEWGAEALERHVEAYRRLLGRPRGRE